MVDLTILLTHFDIMFSPLRGELTWLGFLLRFLKSRPLSNAFLFPLLVGCIPVSWGLLTPSNCSATCPLPTISPASSGCDWHLYLIPGHVLPVHHSVNPPFQLISHWYLQHALTVLLSLFSDCLTSFKGLYRHGKRTFTLPKCNLIQILDKIIIHLIPNPSSPLSSLTGRPGSDGGWWLDDGNPLSAALSYSKGRKLFDVIQKPSETSGMKNQISIFHQ